MLQNYNIIILLSAWLSQLLIQQLTPQQKSHIKHKTKIYLKKKKNWKIK